MERILKNYIAGFLCWMGLERAVCGTRCPVLKPLVPPTGKMQKYLEEDINRKIYV